MMGAQVKLKSFLVVANLVIALLTVAIVVLLALHDRARVEEKAFQSSENLVSVLAGQTSDLLASIDLAMAEIASAVLAAPAGDGGGDSDGLVALLAERQSLARGSRGYFVLDAAGRLLATSLPAIADIPRLSELPEYRVHRDNPEAGQELHSRQIGSDGQSENWVVTVSRRVTDSGGDFAGVVVAVMSMHDFLAPYSALWLGEAGSVSLFNADGVMVARHPFMAEYVGRDFGGEPWMHNYVRTTEKGRILTTTREDGMRRYSGFQWAGEGDAVILVGLDERQTLASWHQRLVFSIVMSALSIVLLVCGSVGLATYFRRRTEWEAEELAAANAARQEVETIFASISDAVYAVDSDWRFTHLNPRAEALLKRSREELLGQSLWDAFPGTRGSLLDSELQRASQQQVTADFEFFYPPLAGWFAVRAYPNGSGLTVYFQDITERVEEKERLRQAQRLDAIGQLTGGVAHDFNNLLTVIMGTSESLLATVGKTSQNAREQLQVILQASERGAALTHRLLAFARKQPLDPRTTDINRLMADAEDMLRRLLAEDIQIELVRGTGLWKAVVDPNELQNAILNLAINARDAMPGGGKLTIETANVAVDADYAAIHDISAGQFVMVAVSDTGEGIAPDTLTKVFEPFFTTKEVGKGSGLGLSMVYGFARQSGGHARIYSEPGEGTTVRLYLPRESGGEDAPSPLAGRARERFRGTESVLVVEDDELVRQHTQNSLGILGYRVTACADGEAALALLDGGDRFDLLLTDVVLPGGMSGRQLADVVVAREPGMKVLYMSGYTENAIVHHGRLDRGVHLLGKPFRLEDLGRKVREVLES